LFLEPRGCELHAVISFKKFSFPQMESIPLQSGTYSGHRARSLLAETTNANCCSLWNQCVSGVGGSKISIGAFYICCGSGCAWFLSEEKGFYREGGKYYAETLGRESRALTSFS
jgi:hypothetical protein